AAQRAPGAELLRRALRPLVALRPSFPAARGRREGERADADLAAELRRALRPADRRGRGGLRARLATAGALGRLVGSLPHDRPALDRDLTDCLPAQSRPERGIPGRGAVVVG